MNQQHQVVEELVRFGAPFGLGLEAGSKPELLAGLALLDSPDSLLVLNGYKDAEYMETALLSQKLGRYPIVVIDRFRELDLLLQVARRLGIRPHIGVRGKLTTKGAGKWMESTGDRSKFGLTATEIVLLLDKLRDEKMLDCLELLHFHIGSQISAVRAIKDAMQEATRIYVELVQSGAGLKFLDVGGGLGVDYDGSSTNWPSSTNYTHAGVRQRRRGRRPRGLRGREGGAPRHHHRVGPRAGGAPLGAGLQHPRRERGAGRALAARRGQGRAGGHRSSWSRPGAASRARTSRRPTTTRCSSRRRRPTCSTSACSTCAAAPASSSSSGAAARPSSRSSASSSTCPTTSRGWRRALADTYYGNFSVFQSVPDHWAVKQLFPIMPLHRLDERPTRRAVMADLTCDSDGKMDQFIELRDVKSSLELHAFDGKPYYIGVFLVGAYQEILGDLHNLFGDTNAVHIALGEGGYRIDHVVEGDSVTEVLGYVQYQKQQLMQRMRQSNEEALRRGPAHLRGVGAAHAALRRGAVRLHLPRGGRARAAHRQRRDGGAAAAAAPPEGDDRPGELPAGRGEVGGESGRTRPRWPPGSAPPDPFRLQPVQRPVLALQVGDVRLDAHRGAGDALDQLGGRVLRPVPVHVLAQPAVQRAELAARPSRPGIPGWARTAAAKNWALRMLPSV